MNWTIWKSLCGPQLLLTWMLELLRLTLQTTHPSCPRRWPFSDSNAAAFAFQLQFQFQPRLAASPQGTFWDVLVGKHSSTCARLDKSTAYLCKLDQGMQPQTGAPTWISVLSPPRALGQASVQWTTCATHLWQPCSPKTWALLITGREMSEGSAKYSHEWYVYVYSVVIVLSSL